MKRFLLAMVFATTSVPLMAEPCLACSCAPRRTDQSKQEYREEQARNADAVFTGKVWRVKGEYGGENNIEAVFWVEDAYKGTRRHRVTVTTASQGSICGYHFKEGKRYTVFGDREGRKMFSTHLCSATQRGRINPDRYGL